jgi:hypothetical protein
MWVKLLFANCDEELIDPIKGEAFSGYSALASDKLTILCIVISERIEEIYFS